MIHELTVTGEESPKDLRKAARRLAMTGGYEVRLAEELSGDQLTRLEELYSVELDQYSRGSAAYRASLAGRIIGLIAEHNACPASLRTRISS